MNALNLQFGTLVLIVTLIITFSLCADSLNARRVEYLNDASAVQSTINSELFQEAHGRPLLTNGKSFGLRKISKIESPIQSGNTRFETRSESSSHQFLIRVEEAKRVWSTPN